MKFTFPKFEFIFCLISVFILALIVGFTRYEYYTQAFNAQKIDKQIAGSYFFGDQCKYTIIDNIKPFEIKSFLNTNYNYKKQNLPLAWYMPPTERPNINEKELIVNVCDLNLGHLLRSEQAWLSVGRVWGETLVFLNESQRAFSIDSGEISFPLLPDDFLEGSKITIVSKLNKYSDGVAGFRGGKPLFVTNSRSVLNKMATLNSVEHTITPLYWLNIYIVLAFFGALAWLLGLKYLDVSWFLVMTTIYAFYWYISYTPDGAVQAWQRTSLFLLNFYGSVAMSIFVFAFLRPKIKPGYIILFFFLISLAYTISYGFADPSSFFRMALRRASYWTTIILFLCTITYGFIKKWNIPDTNRRKRVRFFLCACIAYVIAQSGVGSGLVCSEEIYAQVFDEILLVIYSGFFIADLVVFYRKSLIDKALRIQNEQKMERASYILSMMHMLKHDVRRPFSIVKILINMIKNKNGNLEAEQLNNIQLEVESSLSSVNDMLNDFIALDSRPNIKKETIELVDLVKNVLIQLTPSFTATSLSLKYNLGHNKRIDGDFTKITRIISNIVENAIHAMDGIGEIELLSLSKGSFIELRISNTGPHIPEEDHDKLFSPFFTTKTSGTGLGLAISKLFLEAHGGSLNIESSPSNGVTFICKFPASTLHSYDGFEVQKFVTWLEQSKLFKQCRAFHPESPKLLLS